VHHLVLWVCHRILGEGSRLVGRHLGLVVGREGSDKKVMGDVLGVSYAVVKVMMVVY